MEELRRIAEEMQRAREEGDWGRVLAIYEANRAKVDQANWILAKIDEIAREARERESGKGGAKGPHGGTLVVKYISCRKRCKGCPHGPYLYEEVWTGTKRKWYYLGKVPKGDKG
jgi:hypothetical protein